MQEYNSEMPIGLKMALTENIGAMQRFASLPKSRQKSFIEGARSMESRQDMETHVNSLLQG